ncbi:MAG TPA: zinc-finger domain-containing protein [Rubrivivax sp.]|nr:zinc-finger domain-containing protein [Rubrivivax sp.]
MSEKPQSIVELAVKDLLGPGVTHCPNPAMPLWSNHPRVYLDLTHGQAACAYCGTIYRLKAGEKLHAAH